MNIKSSPTLQKWLGDYWVLWFEKSNTYSVVDTSFKTLLDAYLQANSIENFNSFLDLTSAHNSEKVLIKIEDYLHNCNITNKTDKILDVELDSSHRNILKQYKISNKTFNIYYGSELVLKTIHPSIAHLAASFNEPADTIFDIYLEQQKLYLFKDETFITDAPKRDYHVVQGKFIMQLLCAIHGKTEEDWIGTFHGSAITDGTSSILFIGESGKGKSTLCALLSASGFNLLADDVSPLLSENNALFFNPSAISIKEGSFNVLDTLIPNFNELPTIYFNKHKGPIKYVPCKVPENQFYKCNTIILANYMPKSKTSLDSISTQTLLKILIPESWLSSNPIHAQQFLDWLETLNMYQLTYSDTNSVISKVCDIFKQH